MKDLNIELLKRALESRKKELLLSRREIESELKGKCSCNRQFYSTEEYEDLKYTIGNITDELIDIIEELDKLENLK